VSKDGALLPAVLEVLDLIAHYKLTLATGHVSAEEMLQIVAEARKRGVDHIIITHPGLGPQFTDPTIGQLQQVAAQGAYAEVVVPELGAKLLDNTLKMIEAVGPAHCIVSTDSGLTGSQNHPDALAGAAKTLRAAGFSEADLSLMFKTNPARVLGLPVQ
jgi:predicted TIM-barrel fold metal-dependent hydrolase